MLLTFTFAKLKQEFIRGFETGILLREDSRAFKDYSCPRPELEEDSFFNKANGVVAPMKLMSAMMKEDKLDKTVKHLDLFIKNISDVVAIVMNIRQKANFILFNGRNVTESKNRPLTE